MSAMMRSAMSIDQKHVGAEVPCDKLTVVPPVAPCHGGRMRSFSVDRKAMPLFTPKGRTIKASAWPYLFSARNF